MGLRINRRVNIGKGVNLNIGKRGISTSFKAGKATYNSRGRLTIGTGIKGVSYTTNLKGSRRRNRNSTSTDLGIIGFMCMIVLAPIYYLFKMTYYLIKLSILIAFYLGKFMYWDAPKFIYKHVKRYLENKKDTTEKVEEIEF